MKTMTELWDQLVNDDVVYAEKYTFEVGALTALVKYARSIGANVVVRETLSQFIVEYPVVLGE